MIRREARRRGKGGDPRRDTEGRERWGWGAAGRAVAGGPGRAWAGDGVGFGSPKSVGQEAPQRARGDSQGGVAGGLPPHKGSRLRLTVQSCNGPVVSVQLTMASISSTRELWTDGRIGMRRQIGGGIWVGANLSVLYWRFGWRTRGRGEVEEGENVIGELRGCCCRAGLG